MDPEYEPMKQAEIDELSREAGRPLTEREAYEYLKRRTHRQAVGTMLEPKRDITLEDIDRAERAWRLKQQEIHKYDYRSDGFYYVKATCQQCYAAFDMLAIANAANGTFCPVCQTRKLDEAYQREMENRANQDSDTTGETEEER